ncbi:hypothetical protein INT44_004280 [Umbelopsis vinacea]|uniref:Uncharacterized protein n=1 Tax=Umbelopsis vinacea TaxID=44442 RepID=A0A8H7QAW9_9FUNG|nr:hypothetical protein INT44_004280 [Umbelopsis vinacea]
MLANITRQSIRVIQFLGAIGTLAGHCKETAFINIYEALIDNDTSNAMSDTFIPQVPSVVLFLVSALSMVASLTIAAIAFRKVVRIQRIERAVAFCMVLLWGISVTAVFALDGQFFTADDADSSSDIGEANYNVEIQLITAINVTRAMALVALASWTAGLMGSLLSDCFSDCRQTHDMEEKAQLSNWPLNMTAPPEYSERYGELPHHTSLKPPSTLTSSTSYNRNSFYKTPMEVATRSNSPMIVSHYEDMSSTSSWESSSPSSPLTPTHGLELPPHAYHLPDDPATPNGLRPFSGIPTIRIVPDSPEQDVLPTSFAYLITNPKPVASLRRASSLG